jgi:hypothetical protein
MPFVPLCGPCLIELAYQSPRRNPCDGAVNRQPTLRMHTGCDANAKYSAPNRRLLMGEQRPQPNRQFPVQVFRPPFSIRFVTEFSTPWLDDKLTTVSSKLHWTLEEDSPASFFEMAFPPSDSLQPVYFQRSNFLGVGIANPFFTHFATLSCQFLDGSLRAES